AIADGLRPDQSGLPEDLQMPRDRWPADGEVTRQGADTERPAGQQDENPAALGIAKRFKGVVGKRGGQHGAIVTRRLRVSMVCHAGSGHADMKKAAASATA